MYTFDAQEENLLTRYLYDIREIRKKKFQDVHFQISSFIFSDFFFDINPYNSLNHIIW